MPQQIITPPAVVKAKPEDEANTLIELHSMCMAELRSQYLMMKKATFVNRTYEDEKLYFLVFKPFNKTYKNNISYYSNKAIDAIRKNFNRVGCNDYFITREILAAKIHVNALCYSKEDMVSMYDGKNRLNKFRVSCKMIPKLDRFRVLNYITKEHKVRPYMEYNDFLSRVA